MLTATTKDPDIVLLLSLACGVTVKAAARQSGISERTIYRRLREAKFQRKIQAVRDDMIQRSAGQLTARAANSFSVAKCSCPSGVCSEAAKVVMLLSESIENSFMFVSFSSWLLLPAGSTIHHSVYSGHQAEAAYFQKKR